MMRLCAALRGLILAPGLACALVAASPALAHEVLHSIERDRAVAVKAYSSDGEPPADSNYEVYSPADAHIPYQKGRTDRAGYLAFVPDVTGQWRVNVIDTTGHGFDITIDVASIAAADPGAHGAPALSTAAFILRPLVGLVAIAAVFTGLVAWYRRHGSKR